MSSKRTTARRAHKFTYQDPGFNKRGEKDDLTAKDDSQPMPRAMQMMLQRTKEIKGKKRQRKKKKEPREGLEELAHLEGMEDRLGHREYKRAVREATRSVLKKQSAENRKKNRAEVVAQRVPRRKYFQEKKQKKRVKKEEAAEERQELRKNIEHIEFGDVVESPMEERARFSAQMEMQKQKMLLKKRRRT